MPPSQLHVTTFPRRLLQEASLLDRTLGRAGPPTDVATRGLSAEAQTFRYLRSQCHDQELLSSFFCIRKALFTVNVSKCGHRSHANREYCARYVHLSVPHLAGTLSFPSLQPFSFQIYAYVSTFQPVAVSLLLPLSFTSPIASSLTPSHSHLPRSLPACQSLSSTLALARFFLASFACTSAYMKVQICMHMDTCI